MRVILIGPAGARSRLRNESAAAGLEIVGEAASIEDADALGVDVDAWLVVPGNAEPRVGDELAEHAPADSDAPIFESLTPRELDVLELLAEGLPNKAIAVRLAISDQTVKFHVASIYGKLQASNRTDAVRRAVGRGIITL
jgi:DNA-binding CsgD family transcriptional regulator